MGRSRIKAALFVLSAAALIAAPGGLSATPQEIYRRFRGQRAARRELLAERPRGGVEERGGAAVRRPRIGWTSACCRGGDRQPAATRHVGRHRRHVGRHRRHGGWSGERWRYGAGPVERRPAVHRARSQSDRSRGTWAHPARRSAAARRQAEGVRPRASADGARWRPRSIQHGLNPSQMPHRRDPACARPRPGRSHASASIRECCCSRRSPSSSGARLQA